MPRSARPPAAAWGWVAALAASPVLAAATTPPVATPPAADSGYVAVGGARLYYQQAAAGPDVVLLHDGLLHSVVWEPLWPLLIPSVHAIRYDRRGYGRSDSVAARFSPTDDLHGLLARLGVRRAVFVGCSSGAGLAIDHALEHPDQVAQLILVGPVLHGMATSAHFYRRGERNNEPLARGDLAGAARRWAEDPCEIATGHDSARAARGRLAILQTAERDAPLFPASSTRFFTLSGTLRRFEFLRDRRYRVTGVDVTTNGVVEHFARVGAIGN